MTVVSKLIFGTPFEPNLPRSHNSDVLGADKRIKYFHHHPDLSPMLLSQCRLLRTPGCLFSCLNKNDPHAKVYSTIEPEINPRLSWFIATIISMYHNNYTFSESSKPFITIHSFTSLFRVYNIQISEMRKGVLN